jgi:hypothetical protein
MVNPVKALSGPIDFVVASGESLSDGTHLGGTIPVAIVMPAAWTAASITFQASVDGATFYDVYDTDGTEYTATVGASQYVALNPEKFFGAIYLKVRSGTTSAAVNQGAERTIKVMCGVADRS